MKVTAAFSVAVPIVLNTPFAQAQTSCYTYPSDGTEMDVGVGLFTNPDFCNKECECVRSFPDFESGIPLDTTTCGCSHMDATTSELYCLLVGESGLIPELGMCECTQKDVPSLTCEPFQPATSPVAPPLEQSSMSPVSDVSEPSPVAPPLEQSSMSPAEDVSEPSPGVLGGVPNGSSDAQSRCNIGGFLLTVSSCIIHSLAIFA